jgi:hypothetical protein
MIKRIAIATILFSVFVGLTLAFNYLIFQLENYIFILTNYSWKGVYDIFFWLLAISESFLGVWIILVFIPQRMGKRYYQNVFSFNVKNNWFEVFQVIVLIGISLEIAFSGIWKLLLLTASIFL